MGASPRSEGATLSRDLNEFLIELSIALHRQSMYPTGHPALIPAIESVIRRAERLLESPQQMAFGVARRQLILDGVTTDPDGPIGVKPQVASWPHVKIHPLTFDGLALVGDSPGAAGADAEQASHG